MQARGLSCGHSMGGFIFTKRLLCGWPAACFAAGVLVIGAVAPITAKADPPVAAGMCALIVNGRPALPVFVAPTADADEIAAAGEWSGVLGKMCGVSSSPVATEAAADFAPLSPGVYIGGTAAGRALLAQHPPGDPDGFAIAVDVANRTVILAGATPQATGYAVDWFLERIGGVHWYFPGPLGEVIPARTRWSVPPGVMVEAPAYISRDLGGLSGGDDQTWARRNLLGERFAFIHNVANIFPTTLYDEHPEFFPLRAGVRARPTDADAAVWQPDFSNPAVAAYAAAQARQFFDEHPNAPSFSLGLNDGVDFDEGPGTQALTMPRRWFRGRPDFSDLVFTFMNRAADDLAPAYPDKYLGCLAYYWCENAPTFSVRPQVLPYLTNDRSFYDQPEWAAVDLALINRWAHAGPKIIGIYDYYYGAPFAVPRIFIHAEIKSLRGAYAAGARAFTAELFPVWSYDALKAWLAARMLWNPDQDTAALEAQFYRDLYGPAAGDVRGFFEQAEAAWREQAGSPRWIKGYNDPYQSLIFSPERMQAMSAALTRAAGRQLTSVMHERLENLQGAWAASVQAITLARNEASLSTNGAQNELAVKRGLRLADAIPGDAAACGFYLRAGDWAEQHFQPRWLVDALTHAGANDDPVGLTARYVFALRGPNLLRNGELQAAAGQGPTGWHLNWREAEHVRFGPGSAEGPDGAPVFAVSGSDWMVFWQDVPVDPEKFYETSFLWRGRVSQGARAHWAVAYYDASGQLLESPWQTAAPPGERDVWLREGAVTAAPAKAASLRLLIYVAAQAAGDEAQFTGADIREIR